MERRRGPRAVALVRRLQLPPARGRTALLALLSMVALCLAGLSPAIGSELVYLLKWGSPGSGDGQFDQPSALAVGANGDVYVADRGNHRIQVFNADGTFVTAWGDSGAGDGQFNSPRDVSIDPSSGNVYVTDYFQDRIQVFDASGTFLFKWGTNGLGAGQFKAPRAVHVDDSCHVYVSEDGLPKKRVQKFLCDGTFVLEWGSLGSGDGQFGAPRGISASAAFRIYVTDTVNHRLQIFDSAGTFIDAFGTLGSAPGEFDLPIGVACKPGRIYVSDSNNDRIQVFDDVNHDFLSECGTPCDIASGIGCVDPDGPGGLELGDGQFKGPRGIACDGNGNLYVADTGNNRIQMFATPLATAAPENTPVISALFTAPNPTSSTTTVHFGLSPRQGRASSYAVTARVYDSAGRLVREIDAGRLPAGQHFVEWNGTTQSGRQAPPGVYFFRIQIDGTTLRSAKIVRVH